MTPSLTSSHPQQYFYKVSAFYIKRFGRSLIYKLFSGIKLSPDLDLQGQGHIWHLRWHPLILSNISTKFRLSTLNGLEGVWSTSYFPAAKLKSWPWPSRSRSHMTPSLTSSHPQQYFYKVSAFYIKRFGRGLIYKLFSCIKLSPDLDLQGQGHISHLRWHPLILSNISTKFRLSTLNGLEGVWSTSYFHGIKLSPDLDLQGQGHISHLRWHPLILSNISTKFRLSTLNGLEGVWSTS